MIAYNEFVKQPENAWLKLKPEEFNQNAIGNHIVSPIEQKLWDLYERKKPVVKPLNPEEQERLIADKIEDKFNQMAHDTPRDTTPAPPARIEIHMPAPAEQSRPAGLIDVPENKGWGTAIALALTFAFLAQALND